MPISVIGILEYSLVEASPRTVPSHLRNPSIVRRVLPQSLAPRDPQTLSTITFSSCTKEVFSIMPHLKKVGISETKEEYNSDGSSECLKNLVNLFELETLKCSFYRVNREAQNLYSYALPSNLKKLTLIGSFLLWENMAFVAMLPNVKTLKLKSYAFQEPKWELTTEVFRCLKQLLIDNTILVHWEATNTDGFPCLEHLVLRSCKSLEEILSDVLDCILNRIELHYYSEFAEKSAREYEEQYGGLDVVIRSDW
ncbi:hypothetical protein ACH5RR_030088 [Cinchona calisaya]|uniref:Uncharacterized protein n=1 Tax=Cinchona calisaya TaxID=153742 RepID=A0ABD2YTM5_9GENT